MDVVFDEIRSFTVSDSWQKLNSMPDDPPGSQAYGMGTGNCECFFLSFPIAVEQAMPFENPQDVIEGIHNALADDQALIEVNSFDAVKSRIIYSIIKTRKQPSGVQYTLTMDIATGNEAIHIQGFFDEVGITGQRDAVVYELKSRDGTVTDGLSGWTTDPYYAHYKRDYLMNLSEREEYDTMFPQHPLSVARMFVKEVGST